MADQAKAWRFSPIQNPVNVNFGDGLAVEFGDNDQDAPGPSPGPSKS
jgi:hypothetical protein